MKLWEVKWLTDRKSVRQTENEDRPSEFRLSALCQTLTLRQGALLGQGPAKVCSGLSTTLLPKQSGDYGVRLQRALLQELEPVNMAVCGLILYEMRVLFMCVMQLHSRDLILIACVTSWEVRSL